MIPQLQTDSANFKRVPQNYLESTKFLKRIPKIVSEFRNFFITELKLFLQMNV